MEQAGISRSEVVHRQFAAHCFQFSGDFLRPLNVVDERGLGDLYAQPVQGICGRLCRVANLVGQV